MLRARRCMRKEKMPVGDGQRGRQHGNCWGHRGCQARCRVWGGGRMRLLTAERRAARAKSDLARGRKRMPRCTWTRLRVKGRFICT